MQAKVSIVVPCYNKESYIAAMLDSVLAQKWDNVEVILVNDGSTDDTRTIITTYAPKFLSRGYDLKVIDQENKGCCAAVHAGMLAMTGDYFCLADCDDELYPEYISKMAGFLEENPDYDLAACNFSPVEYRDGVRAVMPPYMYEHTPEDGIEEYILYTAPTAVWIYMVRRAYLQRIKLIENFNTERNRSYEPLFAVPYLAYEGRLKYFAEPLYFFNLHANELSSRDSIASAREYVGDKKKQFDWAIERLDASAARKRRLLSLVELASCYHTIGVSTHLRELESKEFSKLVREYCVLIGQYFTPAIDIDEDALMACHDVSWKVLADAIKSRSEYDCSETLRSAKRAICYGALGHRAEKYYPLLQVLCKIMSKQVLFWDANAKPDSALHGRQVMVPDFESLTEEDLIIVLPIAGEVTEFIGRNSQKASVLMCDSVLLKYLFRMRYCNGSDIKFLN